MKYEDFSKELTVNADLDYNDPERGYWFYNTGCQYPLVCPKGTKVKFKCVYLNYYGLWFEVEYNGRTYYAYPSAFEGNVIIKTQTIIYRNIAYLSAEKAYRLFDNHGNEWLYNPKEEELKLRHKYSSSFYAYFSKISNLTPFHIRLGGNYGKNSKSYV